ncbi:MAG: hypothetical protein Q7P63_03110 [Verrucomicrobiota bacterium JB022]|nr:hypothetical protein [Verrucomicrobiota bacterium JB022]
MSSRPSRTLYLGYFLVLPCLFLYAYWPALSLTYGHFDDYWVITCNYLEPLPWLNNTFSGHGRPIYGILTKLSFLLIDGVPALKWVRLWGVFNLIVLCLSLFYTLRWHSKRPLLAAGLSLLATLTPSTAIYAGWAVCAPFALSAALAVWAAHLHVAAPTLRQFWLSYRAPLALLLFLTASCIYQSAALHLPAALLAFYLVSPRERWSYARLLHGLGFALLTSGLYFIAYKVAVATVLAHSAGVERAALSLDLPAIYAYASERLIPRVFELWGTLLPSWSLLWMGATGLLSLLGLREVCRRQCLPAYHVSLLAVLCTGVIVFTWAPNLIVSGRVSFFRTLNASYLVTLTLAGLGAAEAVRCLARAWPAARGARYGLAGAAVVLFAYQAHYHLQHGYAGVNHHEYTVLRSAVEREFDAFPWGIDYIPPLEHLDDPAYPAQVDEYGLLSSSLDGYETNVLTSIAWDAFGVPPAHERSRVPLQRRHWYDDEAYAQPHLINGLQLIHGYDPREGPQGEPVETIEHPYFGPLKVFRHHWYESPWLGRFYMTDFPVIHHEEYGEFLFYADIEPPYWVSTQRFGTIWLYPESFPDYYDQASAQWMHPDGSEATPHPSLQKK